MAERHHLGSAGPLLRGCVCALLLATACGKTTTPARVDGGASDGSGAAQAGGGSGGEGGGAEGTGGEGTGASVDRCMPNPDPDATTCPTLCPETCDGSDEDCDGVVDEDADGACGGSHATGVCLQGACVLVACDDGYRDCDARSGNGCEAELASDTDHCGGCGQACDFGPGEGRCDQGSCVVDSCWLGYGDCDLDPNNGCEQTLNSLQHCGGCNVACDVGGARPDCSTGTCAALGCPEGTADCDFDPDSACQSLNEAAHCGACELRCEPDALANVAEASCEAATCVLGCAQGFDDCDGAADNGCETELVSLQHCGGCGMPCAIDHAVGTCAGGTCAFLACEPGYADCDGDTANGCEAPLDSLDDCGACGAPCNKASCAGGVCTAVACMAPLADCDRDERDCEANLQADTEHCGACDAGCAFGVAEAHARSASCTAGRCVPSCDAGWDDCDGDPGNGCETSLTGLGNCGSCGAACAIVHADATCGGGQCLVEVCEADWDDCDQDGLSCETPIDTPDNCGGCGQRCELPNALAACGGTPGAHGCGVARCDEGYGDCDLDPNNGCERNLLARGPCAPDDGCERVVADGHVYHLCQSARGYGAARQRCQLQLGGDLVRIDDAAENALLAGRLGAASWIGASDAGHGGTFVWARDRVPFFAGGPGGAVVGGGFAAFAGGQPAADGDCVSMDAGGDWRVHPCDDTRPFICEEAPDGCANDASKWAPGQCGCGAAEVDADGDGFAACAEDCDADPGKQRPGVCGCGTAETDSDNDGTPDCAEDCDDDPAKVDPGACGCGTPDDDSDGDGSLDCVEACDDDPDKTAAGVCGCGTADADSDGDGYEDCIESCDNDPGKQEPGGCGCGAADTDTDGDGSPDCTDGCDDDPDKTAAGVCGCGAPDDDGDGDGVLDCQDGCPNDGVRTAPGDCGCADAPVGAGGACDEGACRAASQCDGAGTCGPGSCGGDERRRVLAIRAAEVNANLADFPLLVRLSDPSMAAARADGRDIYFTDEADNVLDFELEAFSGNTDLVAWVRVPSVSSIADTRLRMYYGSGLALDLADGSGVWSSGFAAVYHMDYGGGAGTQLDASGNGNHLTPSSVGAASVTAPSDVASGHIGRALRYSQSAATCLARPSSASTNLSGNVTFEAWVKLAAEPAQNYNEAIVGHRGGGNSNYQFYYYRHTRKLRFWGNGVESADASVSTAEGSWAHVVGVVDGAAQRTTLYIDGVQRDVLDGTQFNAGGVDASTEFFVGCIWHQASMNGDLDEVRVSSTRRSAAWIAASHANTRTGATFLQVGAETAWNAP